MKVKKKRSHYTVQMLKDGTVLFAFETRKPMHRKGQRAPWIDADGVHDEFIMDFDKIKDFEVPIRASLYSTVAMSINNKRLLRERIEPRLDAIEKAISDLETKLAAIEVKIDLLVEVASGHE